MENRTALGLFLALAVNRPVAALSGRASLSSAGSRAAGTTRVFSRAPARPAAAPLELVHHLVDVDANLLHADLANDIEHHIQVFGCIVFIWAEGQLGSRGYAVAIQQSSTSVES